jgi:hypothetical protein
MAFRIETPSTQPKLDASEKYKSEVYFNGKLIYESEYKFDSHRKARNHGREWLRDRVNSLKKGETI